MKKMWLSSLHYGECSKYANRSKVSAYCQYSIRSSTVRCAAAMRSIQ